MVEYSFRMFPLISINCILIQNNTNLCIRSTTEGNLSSLFIFSYHKQSCYEHSSTNEEHLYVLMDFSFPISAKLKALPDSKSHQTAAIKNDELL